MMFHDAVAHWLARPAPYASYPVLVHRLAPLLNASFRPRLATTPLRFANPSPPSGWVEDSHLQAAEHGQHTEKRRQGLTRRPKVPPCQAASVLSSPVSDALVGDLGEVAAALTATNRPLDQCHFCNPGSPARECGRALRSRRPVWPRTGRPRAAVMANTRGV